MKRTSGEFDLELAIRSWRSGLKHWRAFTADDLEELEGHLRDVTASLMEEGIGKTEAFERARAHLGDLDQMERAYKKVYWRKLKHRRQMFGAVANHLMILRNYAIIAIRSLSRHRGYSALNISGLAVGFTSAFLIILWVQAELSVDQFHERGDSLVQVLINDASGDNVTTWRNVPVPLAELLENDFPEVERSILTLPITAALARDRQASRERAFFASPGFFDAFTFPLLKGDMGQLENPGSVAISEAVAARYFGTDWADRSVVGETIRLNYWQSAGGVLGNAVTVEEPEDLVVAGVFQAVPRESSVQFDVILPVSGVLSRFGHLANWGPRWFELTLQLRPGTDQELFAGKIASALPGQASNQVVSIQPTGSAYLHNSFEGGVASGGRIQQVYLIGLVGLAIMLMACINFANLVTARAGGRAREIGVRKALGATPTYLVQQFLSEAILTTLVAFAFAIAGTVVALPVFNAMAGTTIQMADLTIVNWVSFLAIAFVTGCLAGSYPAFYLAALKPVQVLRGKVPTKRKGEVGIRKGLVVFQFAVSSVLVVGTLTIYQQLSYLQNKDLGIDQENVVMMRLEGSMVSQYQSVRETLLRNAAITELSRTSEEPIGIAIKNSSVFWEGKGEEEQLLFTVARTDAQFAETLKLNMTAGRFFDEARDSGQLRFVVNESAVRAMGLSNPIGHPMAFGFDLEGDGAEMGQIVGVVKDFHTASLVEEEIAPLVFRYEPEETRLMLARIAPGETPAALAALEDIQRSLNPGYPFEYTFLDESYQRYYEDEAVLGMLSQLFAFVALVIAALGLLGLAAYSIQQRTKEIGVRRVLGASTVQLYYTLTRDFMTLVVVALLLSLPLAFLVMRNWLDSFAYRFDLGAGTVMMAAGASLLIALSAVGYQAGRAIRMGAVASLRSE
jgi:putative ABC transport system permease protein